MSGANKHIPVKCKVHFTVSTRPQGRPLQLQVSNSGAWKTVSRWDNGDVEAGELVHEAVALLGGVDTSCTWRITTQEKHPVVLKRWTAANGWSTKR